MNRDDLIRMAREAGWGGDAAEAWMEGFLFGAASEREACAKVSECNAAFGNSDEQWASRECAKFIRARGEGQR